MQEIQTDRHWAIRPFEFRIFDLFDIWCVRIGIFGVTALTTLLGNYGAAHAQDQTDLAKVIAPFVEKYCVQCRGAKKRGNHW